MLDASDEVYALMELDARASRNPARVLGALEPGNRADRRTRFVLNRVPRFSGRRIGHLCDNLGISLHAAIPDGGPAVRTSAELHRPLALYSRHNTVRRRIAKLARALHEERHAASTRSARQPFAVVA